MNSHFNKEKSDIKSYTKIKDKLKQKEYEEILKKVEIEATKQMARFWIYTKTKL
jgi:hypothetical protein